MDNRTFDAVARSAARAASRRRVLGGLAATVAAVVVGRTATAAPSPKAGCMKLCASTAKECRMGTKGLKGKERATALKACKTEFQTCRAECVGNGTDDDEEETPEA